MALEAQALLVGSAGLPRLLALTSLSRLSVEAVVLEVPIQYREQGVEAVAPGVLEPQAQVQLLVVMPFLQSKALLKGTHWVDVVAKVERVVILVALVLTPNLAERVVVVAVVPLGPWEAVPYLVPLAVGEAAALGEAAITQVE